MWAWSHFIHLLCVNWIPEYSCLCNAFLVCFIIWWTWMLLSGQPVLSVANQGSDVYFSRIVIRVPQLSISVLLSGCWICKAFLSYTPAISLNCWNNQIEGKGEAWLIGLAETILYRKPFPFLYPFCFILSSLWFNWLYWRGIFETMSLTRGQYRP